MRTIRMIYAASVAGTALISLVAISLPPLEGSVSPVLFALILLADAALSFGMLLWVRHKPLDISSSTTLATTFRATVILSIALALSPTLVAFAGVLVTGRLWIFLPGLGLTLFGLGWIAPGWSVARRQAEITASGSPLSLEIALDGRDE